MCECMKTVSENVSSHLKSKIPEGCEISNGWGDTGWDNEVLSFADGKSHVMLRYKMAYRMKKKDGSMAKNLTRLETSVKMSYCPFCGERKGGDHA